MRQAIRKSKFILALSLAVVMLVAIVGTSVFAYAAGKSNKASYAAGDDIAFGTLDGHIINWTILSYDDKTKVALIISRSTLSSYSITSYREAIDANYRATGAKAGYVRWEESYWRGWLNKSFFEDSFTPEEQERIQQTTLTDAASKESLMNFYHDTTLDAEYIKNQKKNSLNQNIYNTQTTTADHIFFLSTDEYTEHKDTIKNETPIPYSWPLRTNSYDDPAFGLYVNEGTKLIEKRYFYTGTGIRPAMYIRLEKPDEDAAKSDDANKTANGANSTASDVTGTNTAANNTAATNTGANNATANNAAATNTVANNATAGNAAANNASGSNTNGGNIAQPAVARQTNPPAAKPVSTRKYANNGTQIGSIMLPYDASYQMARGATAQVAIDLAYLNFTDKQYTVEYKSSDASVFTVDAGGHVTATGRGTATLEVRMIKSNGRVYSMVCVISVD